MRECQVHGCGKIAKIHYKRPQGDKWVCAKHYDWMVAFYKELADERPEAPRQGTGHAKW